MPTLVEWHGTQEEALELVNCVARNCACQFSAMGSRMTLCDSHRMMSTDQRALDGLLFARYMVALLWAEELSGDRAGSPDEVRETSSSAV